MESGIVENRFAETLVWKTIKNTIKNMENQVDFPLKSPINPQKSVVFLYFLRI